MRSLEAPKEFLTSVLNELRHDGKLSSVRVKEQFTGNRLFRFSLDEWIINDIIDKDEYRVKYQGVANRCGENLRGEVPSWTDFRSCLWSSLVVPPSKKNMEEISSTINDIIAKSRKGLNYEGQTAISIDTNLMYNRLITRLFLERSRFGIEYENCKDLMVLVSMNCKREITRPSQKKLDSKQNPSDLQKWVSDSRLSDSLFNKPTLQARKALNGIAELNRIRESFSYYEADNVEFVRHTNDDMDQAIVAEVCRYAHDNKIQVAFLTADDSMLSLLAGENLRHCIVDYPIIVPPTIKPGPWLLRELLYDLSITYGAIELEEAEIRIEGLWPGKDICNFIDPEKVCISVDENTPLGKEIIRNHKIMTRFQKSDIIELERLS